MLMFMAGYAAAGLTFVAMLSLSAAIFVFRMSRIHRHRKSTRKAK